MHVSSLMYIYVSPEYFMKSELYNNDNINFILYMLTNVSMQCVYIKVCHKMARQQETSAVAVDLGPPSLSPSVVVVVMLL